MFAHLIGGFEKEQQAQLRYALFRSQMKDEMIRRRETEQWKQEIADDVLSRISMMIDTSDAAEKTKELRQLIDNLGT